MVRMAQDVLAARAAGRRPRQLRLARRRRRRRLPLHRGRLAPLAIELLDELEQETVDFRPNYDGTTEEPIVLPAQFPHLLVNGSTGIAVGMATNIPPHNLGEVCEALVALDRRPQARDQGPAQVHQGARLPDRRPDHEQQEGAARDLRDRAGRRPRCAASGRSSEREAAATDDHRHVDPVRAARSRRWSSSIAEVIIGKKLPHAGRRARRVDRRRAHRARAEEGRRSRRW